MTLPVSRSALLEEVLEFIASGETVSQADVTFSRSGEITLHAVGGYWRRSMRLIDTCRMPSVRCDRRVITPVQPLRWDFASSTTLPSLHATRRESTVWSASPSSIGMFTMAMELRKFFTLTVQFFISPRTNGRGILAPDTHRRQVSGKVQD